MATMQDLSTTIGKLKHCTNGLVLSPKAAHIILICIIVRFGCFFFKYPVPKTVIVCRKFVTFTQQLWWILLFVLIAKLHTRLVAPPYGGFWRHNKTEFPVRARVNTTSKIFIIFFFFYFLLFK